MREPCLETRFFSFSNALSPANLLLVVGNLASVTVVRRRAWFSSTRPPLAFRAAARALLVWALLVGASASKAAPTANSSPPTPHKYLFLVETSKAMQRRAQGVHNTLKTLIGSNLSGQLRAGDSLAIWSFNETIFTNRFPFQEWSAATGASFGARLPDFLEAATYEKRALLDKAMVRVSSLIANSELITIILVTSGEEEIKGTPFDKELKAAFAQWRNEQQKTRMPLLTLLRASQGRFVQWSVTPAPWPLEIPPLTPEMAARNLSKNNPPPLDAAANNRTVTNQTKPVASVSPGSLVVKGNPQTPSPSPLEQPHAAAEPAPAVPATKDANVAVAITTNSPPPSEPKPGPAEASVPGRQPSPIPPNNSEHPTDIPLTADSPRREAVTQSVAIPKTEANVPPPPSQPDPVSAHPTQTPTTSEIPINTIPPVSPQTTTHIAMSTPPNFFHENAKWLLGAFAGGIGAAVCLLLWLNSYTRSQVNLLAVGKSKKPKAE